MENKKVGILTFHRALNYGAVWQCWALKSACENLGFNVEVLDYHPFGHYTYCGFLRHRPDRAISYLKNFYYFNNFVSSHLKPTQHTEDHNWIENNCPKEDIYIVGSDTIWSENVVGDLINSYVLDFVHADAKKIAYAPSLGGVYPHSQVFFDELKKFDAVALREPQYCKELSTESGLYITDVCDPSLLIDASHYIKMEKNIKCPDKYIAVFDLAGDQHLKETALNLKRLLGLPLLNLAGNYCGWTDINYWGLSPQQWIYLIHHASFVCTNSFHGTAFSVVFRVPFVTCKVKTGGRSKTNSRVENLLNQCGLLSQYIDDPSKISDKIGMSYSGSENKILCYRNRSVEWLNNALNNETNKER